MLYKFILIALSNLAILFAATGGAATSAEGTGLTATYFSALNFQGSATTRIDPRIDFDFVASGTGVPNVGPEGFSVIWQGQVVPTTSELYTFTTTSDDGISVWIDDTHLIDQFTDHAPQNDSGSIALVAGVHYNLIVQYYQNRGGAVARLSWSTPTIPMTVVPQAQLYPETPKLIGNGSGLYGIYYSNDDLTGTTAVRVDPTIDFAFGNAGPGLTGLATGGFSTLWQGEVQAQFTEEYTFITTSDSGIELQVDGQILVSNQADHRSTENSGTIALEKGKRYQIGLKYRSQGSAAACRMEWSSASTPRTLVPQSQLYPTLIATPGEGTGLLATYFANKDLSTPIMTRTDQTVNFDFIAAGTGSLDVGPNDFSVLWQGQVQAQASETYTFITTSDDGVSLMVNGVPLINDWNDHSPIEDRGSMTLVAGQKYDIVMKYYNRGGGAIARLEWLSQSTLRQIIPQTQLYPGIVHQVGTGTGLNGTYYASKDFSNQVGMRTDPSVNFIWSGSGPGIGEIGAEHYSVVWQGQVQAQVSETYTFTTTSDDGVVLWVDGQRLVNNMTDHAPTQNSGSITLVAGQKYAIVMEYYNNAGGAQARLEWDSPSTPRTVIPSTQFYPIVEVGSVGANDGTTTLGQGQPFSVSPIGSGSIVTYNSCGVSPTSSHHVDAGGLYPFLTDVPGTYVLKLLDSNGIETGSTQIVVVGTDLSGQPIADAFGYTRTVTVTVSPDSAPVSFVSSDPTLLSIGSPTFVGHQATFNVTSLQPGYAEIRAQVRSGAGAVVIARRRVDGFRLRSTAAQYIAVIAVNSDGSKLALAELIMKPLIPDINIPMTTFSAGLTFDDSTTSRLVSTNDFFPDGTYPYRLLRAANGYIHYCHTYRAMQNGVWISP